jgi:hypothetical protein
LNGVTARTTRRGSGGLPDTQGLLSLVVRVTVVDELGPPLTTGAFGDRPGGGRVTLMLSDVIFFVHCFPPFIEIGEGRTTPRSGTRRAISNHSRVNKKEPLREKRLLDGSDHVAG